MSQKRQLKSLIYSVYDSESDCASQMGWTKQRLNRIINGNKEPNVGELQQMAGALHKTVAEIADIFLSN